MTIREEIEKSVRAMFAVNNIQVGKLYRLHLFNKTKIYGLTLQISDGRMLFITNKGSKIIVKYDIVGFDLIEDEEVENKELYFSYYDYYKNGETVPDEIIEGLLFSNASDTFINKLDNGLIYRTTTYKKSVSVDISYKVEVEKLTNEMEKVITDVLMGLANTSTVVCGLVTKSVNKILIDGYLIISFDLYKSNICTHENIKEYLERYLNKVDF